MNDKELKAKREELRNKGYGWVDGKYIEPPKEHKLLEEELWCIEMINSILCYNCQGYTDAEKVIQYEEKSHHNYLADYIKVLGRDKVAKLIDEQIKSIKYIKTDVFTDDEGCSYNSIVWND
jgi:hypothetical protein